MNPSSRNAPSQRSPTSSARDTYSPANNYIERKCEKVEPPAETRKRFYDLIQKTRKSEEKFLDLLVKGGYVDGK